VANVKGITVLELLEEIVEDRTAADRGPYEALTAVYSGDARNGERTTVATVTVRSFGEDCEPVTATSVKGSVDACLMAAAQALRTNARLVSFEEQSLGEGTDALAKAWITLEQDGRTVVYYEWFIQGGYICLVV